MLGMFGFGPAQTFGMALAAYWSAYLMRRVYEPLYMAWINRHAETRVRATVISLSGQVDAIGQIVGGPLFGILAITASTGAAIVAAGVALLPALLLYRLAPRAPAAVEDDSATPALAEG
jgi:DHA3 family tetracycline resistance protein-like MFS transporter